MHNAELTRPFLDLLIGETTKNFNHERNQIKLFSPINPNPNVEFEYILGIAPYKRKLPNSGLEGNLDSISDAWIFGGNFTILVEVKVRGTLDDSQLAAHQTKFSKPAKVIEASWQKVFESFNKLDLSTKPIEAFLIQQFLSEYNDMNAERRRSSGMPKEIIGGVSKEHEVYFIISGSKQTDFYTVDLHLPSGSVKRLNNSLSGIQQSRRWIANYVKYNYKDLNISFEGDKTIINDLCVKPGRFKNAWNQWRLGSYL
ncbi:hypothetical protein M3699_12790 [Peribacillus simplex]|uniref:hypothetical protein n=1 Tax=Peribacillus simplex TaxID=1478 RepID=UPI00203B3012|nr:hypothetical protein [Peribacillus simplex]MCM3674738.1 hypothetical protein [Peribacillus simplex]